MTKLTALENKFMEALAVEAYGGTVFSTDVVKHTGETGKTMSGVISSLIQKKIILVADDEMVGLVIDANDVQFPIYGVEWEISTEMVKEIIELANA